MSTSFWAQQWNKNRWDLVGRVMMSPKEYPDWLCYTEQMCAESVNLFTNKKVTKRHISNISFFRPMPHNRLMLFQCLNEKYLLLDDYSLVDDKRLILEQMKHPALLPTEQIILLKASKVSSGDTTVYSALYKKREIYLAKVNAV